MTNHADIDGPEPRDRRRPARAVLAATIVVVLGGGALLAACGSDIPGPSGASRNSLFLLPPEGGEILGADGTYAAGTDGQTRQIGSYLIRWREASGVDVTLSVGQPGAVTAGRSPITLELGLEAPSRAEELIEVADSVWGTPMFAGATSLPVEAGVLDPAVSFCVDDPTVQGSPMVVGTAGRALAFVDESRPVPAPCEEILHDSAALRASRELRLVTEAEWWAFMDQWGEVSPATTGPQTLIAAVSLEG